MKRKTKPVATMPKREPSGHCFFCRGVLTAIQPGGGKPWLHEDGVPYEACTHRPAKTEAA